MGYSLTLGRLFGTPVRLHVTFVVFLLVIGGVAYAQGGAASAVATVSLIALLFGCVVLHEFGHILAGRRYGVTTRDVILLPIGGVARMEGMPRKPAQEIVVALAGPAVNVVIAAVLFLALGGLPSVDATMQTDASGIAARLLYANILLVVFNLIPAFPMDGGRVLRALLVTWRGPAMGTRDAVLVGRAFAILFGLTGLASGNVVLVLIGVFIFFAGASENQAAQVRHAVRGLRNKDVMITQFATLGLDSSLGDAIDCRLRTGQSALPVTDRAGHFAGLVPRDVLSKRYAQAGMDASIVAFLTRDTPLVNEHAALEVTVDLMQQKQAAVAGVLDRDGALVGLVTQDTLRDVMALSGGGGRHAGIWRGGPSEHPAS